MSLFYGTLGINGSIGVVLELSYRSVLILQSLYTALLYHYLRKHAYSNILKILPPKKENFQIILFDIFHISAQNIDCGYPLEPPRRGGSIEYPQSMFLSRKKKNNVYPFKPQFYCIKVGFKGSKLYRHVFVMTSLNRTGPSDCRFICLHNSYMGGHIKRHVLLFLLRICTVFPCPNI